jgi:hypothetical protein
MSLAPGTRLRSYDVLSRLGAGGMGEFWRARDRRLRSESWGSFRKVFEFDDPESRIDYPVWSPDGRFVLFDRFRPRGGDVWVMDNFE